MFLFLGSLSLFLMDILNLVYDDEAPSDEIGERYLSVYDTYIGFTLEWEREYWLYYVDEFDDENGDSRDLDEYEWTEGAFILVMWYYRLLYRLNYFIPHEKSGVNYLKSLQILDFVKKHKLTRKKK